MVNSDILFLIRLSYSIIRYLIFNEKYENSKSKLAKTGQLTPSSAINQSNMLAWDFSSVGLVFIRSC